MNNYEKNNVRLLQGDCMDLMKDTPDNYYDLAIVDPPYGISVNVNMGRRKGDKNSDYKKFAGEDKNIPSKNYFIELKRISKNQIIWGGNYMTNHLNPSPCWLMWDKGFSEDVTFAQYELAWTSFNTSAKKYDFNSAANRNRIHPTQKPIKLYEWLLMNYANEGDKILDTHLGSGSSAIAAHKMHFDFTGIELDEEYYQAAVKRFKQTTSQLSLI